MKKTMTQHFTRTLLIFSILFLSINVKAAIIVQDIFIDIDIADAGNSFDIELTDSGLFGALTFDSEAVDFGYTAPDLDPLFSFTLSLKDLLISSADDTDPDISPEGITDEFAPMDGIIALYSFFETSTAFGSIIDREFEVMDNNGLMVTGMLTFGAPTTVDVDVPAPATVLLMLLPLGFIIRKKCRQ